MGFLEDVVEGLSAQHKHISSRYFYDAHGDRLFQAIMKLPEYYLTRAEYEILSTQGEAILNSLQFSANEFDLVEFGAGDGLKSLILISQLLELKAAFRYIPIDISSDVLRELSAKCSTSHPTLEVYPLNKEYFEALSVLKDQSPNPKLVLFLGSSIGNFLHEKSMVFLANLSQGLAKGDQILIGFDLKKNPKTILAAYNDSQGVTKAFNMNLLTRINRELDANFDLEAFDHYPHYDPETGLAKSYLVSMKKQAVSIGKANRQFMLQQGEVIHTEISRKYDLPTIETLYRENGFLLKQHFFDCKHQFVLSLAEKA